MKNIAQLTSVVVLYLVCLVGMGQSMPILDLRISNDEDSTLVWSGANIKDTIFVPHDFSVLRFKLPYDSYSNYQVGLFCQESEHNDIWINLPDYRSDSVVLKLEKGYNRLYFEKFDSAQVKSSERLIVIHRPSSPQLHYLISGLIFVVVLGFIAVSRGYRKRETIPTPNYSRLLEEDENIMDVINTIIEEHIDNNAFTSQVIAEKLNIKRSNLAKVFKKETGKTAKDYILSYKLSLANDMISKGQPLDEIALKLGFSSASYLLSILEKEKSNLGQC